LKYYIKQKVFTLKDKFTVKDETGSDIFYVEGEFFSIGKKLHLYTMDGTEQAYIHQKVMSILKRYIVECSGGSAEIVKEFTLLTPKYSVKGPGWTVDGSLTKHDYNICYGRSAVASVKKAWFTWGDSYEIEIADGVDEVLAIAVVLAIDCATSDDGASTSSTS